MAFGRTVSRSERPLKAEVYSAWGRESLHKQTDTVLPYTLHGLLFFRHFGSRAEGSRVSILRPCLDHP